MPLPSAGLQASRPLVAGGPRAAAAAGDGGACTHTTSHPTQAQRANLCAPRACHSRHGRQSPGACAPLTAAQERPGAPAAARPAIMALAGGASQPESRLFVRTRGARARPRPASRAAEALVGGRRAAGVVSNAVPRRWSGWRGSHAEEPWPSAGAAALRAGRGRSAPGVDPSQQPQHYKLADRTTQHCKVSQSQRSNGSWPASQQAPPPAPWPPPRVRAPSLPNAVACHAPSLLTSALCPRTLRSSWRSRRAAASLMRTPTPPRHRWRAAPPGNWGSRAGGAAPLLAARRRPLQPHLQPACLSRPRPFRHVQALLHGENSAHKVCTALPWLAAGLGSCRQVGAALVRRRSGKRGFTS